MPFDTACPECSARLRLDAPPAKGHPVECPKCGALFVPPRPKKAEADKPAAGEKKKKSLGEIKQRKVKKKKTNPVILVGSIVLGFGALIGLGVTMIWFLNRAGKVEEMLTYVPGDCNWARGVNVSQLTKYPGYAQEVDKHLTPDVKAAADAIAEAAGIDPTKFLDYFVVAKNLGAGGRESTVYVFRSQRAVSLAQVNQLVGGGPTGGRSTSGKGVLAGGSLYTPSADGRTGKIFVVVPRGSEALNAGVMGGKEASFAKTGLDDCGGLCVRGSIWLVGRTTGRLKNYVANSTGVLGTDLPALAAAGKQATTFGVWTTPGGGGVRVGVAMQCADAKTATELVKAMKDGPLGKQDESEPTNQLKSHYSDVGDKKFFSEIMQMMSYRSRRACAYFVTSGSDERAKKLLDKYNGVMMGTTEPPAPAATGG